MNREQKFREKFAKDFPDFNNLFVNVHNYEKNGKTESFALICNMQEKGLNADEMQKLEQQFNSSQNGAQFLCEFFYGNEKALELITTYFINNGKIDDFKDVMSFVENGLKTKKVGLKKYNSISGFKINEDGSLENEIAFKMNFKIEKVNGNNRCWISSAESREDIRGKGVYTKVLSNMLPKILEKYRVKAIGLHADAFAVNADKSQKELETFYISNGFTKVSKSELADNISISRNDFEDGKPVFLKPIYLAQEICL